VQILGCRVESRFTWGLAHSFWPSFGRTTCGFRPPGSRPRCEM